MVLVGFVIEKSDKVFTYIKRFDEVFSKVRASPFSKRLLFDSFHSNVKIFSDRVVFMYSGKIGAFSTIMFLLRYSLIALVLLNIFLGINRLLPSAMVVLTILFLVGITILLFYYFSYSKYGFWFGHKRSFCKKHYLLGKNKKKLLSSSEVIDCFIWNVKPLFKDELGDKL